MTETEMWDRIAEERALRIIAEQKLAKYEARKAKNRDRMRAVRACARTNAHNDAQTPPLPSVSSSSPTPPIITSSPLPSPFLLTSFVKTVADAPGAETDLFGAASPDQTTAPPRPTRQRAKAPAGSSGPKPASDKRPNDFEFMGEIRAVFKNAYGVNPKLLGWAQSLRGPVAELGLERVIEELKAYCAMTPLTCVSYPKFTGFCGGWQEALEKRESYRPMSRHERVMAESKRTLDRLCGVTT